MPRDTSSVWRDAGVIKMTHALKRKIYHLAPRDMCTDAVTSKKNTLLGTKIKYCINLYYMSLGREKTKSRKSGTIDLRILQFQILKKSQTIFLFLI